MKPCSKQTVFVLPSVFFEERFKEFFLFVRRRHHEVAEVEPSEGSETILVVTSVTTLVTTTGVTRVLFFVSLPASRKFRLLVWLSVCHLYLLVCLFVRRSDSLTVCLFVCLPACPPVYLFVFLFCLSVCLTVCLFILPILSAGLSVYLSAFRYWH